MHREREKGQHIKDLEIKSEKNKQVPTEVSQSNVVMVEKESDAIEQLRESDDMAKAELNENVNRKNDKKKAIEHFLILVIYLLYSYLTILKHELNFF